MNKPYIICYMMTSVDGRIDCAMTEHLPGEEYYPILESFGEASHVNGKITSQMEIALPGKFLPQHDETYHQDDFHISYQSKKYDIIIDNVGELNYEKSDMERPTLIITSQRVTKDYLKYLESRQISWVVSGKEHVDLRKACEILKNEFHIEKLIVTGGGHINAGFLKENLLDEVILLIGAGIDGREGMCSVFDGLEKDSPVKQLELEEVKSFKESGAVLLRYKVA